MSFLARWSRRKAASREVVAPEPPPPDLPPIESLGAGSDYTVFLARGVSRAVQAQALGIAWASDPAIANFRGMAEYAWDFNAPGYGELGPADDAAEWLGQIVRSGSKIVAAVAEEASPLVLPEEAQPALAADVVVPPPAQRIAEAPPLPEVPAAEETVAALPKRRRHGGALPV
jgi:hypothetical protein